MTISAIQLAQLVNGTLEGNPEATVSRVARIEEAQEGDFAFLDNPRYEPYLYSTKASIVMVKSDLQPTNKVNTTLLRVNDVRSSLAFLLELFQENNGQQQKISEKSSIHERARIAAGSSIGDFVVVEEGAVIGENCTIYPNAYIGRNVHIGEGTIIYSGVRIYYDCTIGKNCIIHANAVIGADGFGFAPQPDKTWKKVPQVGNVIIEDNVEVGACTCIDRAALGSTFIRSGVKLDNLVHIAHNVEVGKNTAMAAQVGVAGSAKIGEFSKIGGQTGIAGHIALANGLSTQAQSGVGSSVEKENVALFGTPAFDYKSYVRSHIVFKQLPDVQKTIRDLEKRIKELEEKFT